MDSVHQTPELTQNDENSTNWNCVTSKKLLVCYFEYFKETEENNGDVIRSNPADCKKFTCSTEEYQESIPSLRENAWYEQLCKCLNCLKMYQDQGVEFLFGIKNIECLPTEIILMIFTYLMPSERRIAADCCKRFRDIWLRDIFNNDRRLVFDCCVLDPEREPLSVFMKSSIIHRSLAVGDVIMRGESVFEGNFGENVTSFELIYDPELPDAHAYKNLSIFSQFSNLKTIKANDRQLGDFSNVPTTLELLSISGCGWYETDKQNTLKRYLDKTSDAFRVELNFTISTEHIISFTDSQRNKIQSVHLSLKAGDSEFKLPRFKNLKYLELDFHYECDYGSEEILDNFKEQLPSLKDLSIQIHKRLLHKNWACLKTLTALNIPKEELPRLTILENLKELTLETFDDKCFFVHKTFLNKYLQTLDINSIRILCFTCFQTMTKSFPDLRSLNCGFRVTNDHLEELATNTPKLKYLKLHNVDPSISFACLPNLTELENYDYLTPYMIETWPLMLHLQKCVVSLMKFNVETATIFERMPALEDLTIIFHHKLADLHSFFEAMTEPLKRLKKIQICCTMIKIEVCPVLIDIMSKNCKNLRKIKFYNHGLKSYQNRMILTQLLQKYSSIRCIDDVWLKKYPLARDHQFVINCHCK